MIAVYIYTVYSWANNNAERVMRTGGSRSSGSRGGRSRRVISTLLRIALVIVTSVALSPVSASTQPLGTCETPATTANRLAEPWWAARHAQILSSRSANPGPDVVLLGDSIVHNFDKAKLPDENFRPTWDRFYAPRHALNLGFSGDTTANLLWRLRNGEIDGIAPKVVIILIGTNDTARNAAPAKVVCGIQAVIDEVGRRLPDARILLFGILPSAISDAKSAADESVNTQLARRYAENDRVTYLDIGAIFLDADNGLDTELFYDPRLTDRHAKALHPDTVGQRRMAEAIEPTLAKLLNTPPQVALSDMVEANTAVIPVPRLERDFYDWYQRHHDARALASTLQPTVVMIGDSITHMWGGEPVSTRRNGPQAWGQLFGTTPVLNLGFGWDRTQNVLWRLRAGELDGVAPREVILNIGTNNLTGSVNARANTPQEVVAGIAAIVAEIRKRTPKSRITLMAIFPRGALPGEPLRQPITETNRLLAKRYGNDPHVRFLDIGAQFLTAEGELRPGLMLDGTHPSEAGYAVWARSLTRAGLMSRHR
jgi:lysophospholipase L1-like esterase